MALENNASGSLLSSSMAQAGSITRCSILSSAPTDLAPSPTPALRAALLFAPALIPLLGAFHQNSHVFLALTFLNVTVYAYLYSLDLENRLAFQLLLACAAGLIAGAPHDLAAVVPQFARGRYVTMGFDTYIIFQALLSKRPQSGLCGALVLTVTRGGIGLDQHFQFSVQAGLVFLLLHSLRWMAPERKAASIIRVVAALAWVAHSVAWTRLEPMAEVIAAISSSAWKVITPKFLYWDSSWRMSEAGVMG